MKRLFDPDVIRVQIANLEVDRERINRAIESLQNALHSIEKLEAPQVEFAWDGSVQETTLNDAVKRACMAMIDGITRQRVISAIERAHPGLHPKSASVAASLVNLTKGDTPSLFVAVEGKGRSPAFYSTQGDTTILHLSSDEIEALLDEAAIRGSGGWQSLWHALLKSFNKAKGTLALTAELRARVFNYYHSYGGGGWQNRAKRIFRRELPHLFAV